VVTVADHQTPVGLVELATELIGLGGDLGL
jgi:hypothetical protein